MEIPLSQYFIMPYDNNISRAITKYFGMPYNKDVFTC